jgi:hypothetical protein
MDATTLAVLAAIVASMAAGIAVVCALVVVKAVTATLTRNQSIVRALTRYDGFGGVRGQLELFKEGGEDGDT